MAPLSGRCSECGCGELDPCVLPDGSTCFWTLPWLCSVCFATAYLVVYPEVAAEMLPVGMLEAGDTQ